MPYPYEYSIATQTWHQVLDAIKDETDLASSNQAFTVLEGVLRTFRRRLDLRDSLRFADALPVALRALYVHDWDIDEERRPFAPPLELADEVRSLRSRHNSAPDTAVPDVARAVRQFVHPTRFDELIASLPDGAAEFWRG
ncbi:MAG: DUF2267 domain-containing protein [Pseudonocardia sp.]|nr:DUF2267 domain-containing protein [Pseudonocardia sp.]